MALTDKAKLIELLDSFGCKWSQDEHEENGIALMVDGELGTTTKVTGYLGMTTIFRFDADDKFVEVGIWD